MLESIAVKIGLSQSIETAWKDFNAYLSGLTEYQLTELRDIEGWTIKDHLSHIWAWEEALLLLFKGTPRYITLGVDPTKSLNEVNAVIRNRLVAESIEIILDKQRDTHAKLMAKISSLTDEDLKQPAAIFFTETRPGEKRNVAEFIQYHTDSHFLEYLAWIKELADRSFGHT